MLTMCLSKIKLWTRFDFCDHCGRWRLSHRMKERYMEILCRRCWQVVWKACQANKKA